MSSLFLASVAVLFAPAPATPPDCPAPSGASATVLVPDAPALESSAGPLAPGDVVAVFADGACVGSSVWEGDGVAISVWEDDPYTSATDGFETGAPFEIRTWSAATGATAAADVTFEIGYGDESGLRSDALYLVAVQGAEPGGAPFISEVDADPSAAFVELRAESAGATLPDVTLVAVDADGVAYGALALGGTLASGDATVVVRPEGASDGIAMPGVSAFETGPAAFALYPTVSAPAVGQAVADFDAYDALVSRPADEAFPAALVEAVDAQVAYVDAAESSLARLGGGPLGAASLAYAVAPTPGSPNPTAVRIDLPTAPGLRLTSLPVLDVAGEVFTVDDLAVLGPVAGVPGSNDPDAEPTIWTGVDAAGAFAPAPSVTTELAPGASFLWDWMEPAEGARSGGPARFSAAKASTSLQLSGQPIDDVAMGGPFLRALGSVAADGHVLVGNPYAYPLRLSGLGLQGGATMQTALATWDPAEQTYVNLFARPDAPEFAGVLPTWGGALAEVAGGGDLVATTSSGHVAPGAEPGGAAPEGIAFHLSGALDGGATTEDRAAHIVYVDGATAGWDPHDASKLTPPLEEHALIAAVGQRDGEARRQRVLSLPAGAEAEVRLAFTSTTAGTFTLRWDNEAGMTGVKLVDHVSGVEFPIDARSEYTFEAEATAWTERFSLTLPPTSGEPGPGESEVLIGDPYPNPTASESRLRLHAGQAQTVHVDLVDALGRRVARHAAALEAGVPVELGLGTRALAPGLYLAVVRGETFAQTRRLTVVR